METEVITRITPSLLLSWQWSFRREGGYEDFLSALNREPRVPSPAMQHGIHFENLIHHELACTPVIDDSHEWYTAVKQAAAILQGSAEQVRGERPITVDGKPYLLVGVADNLKAGIIYDTKMSKGYEYGNYSESPQHPAYFYLWPEAWSFTYLVFNGKELSQETYSKFATEEISNFIRPFRRYLDEHGLTEIYLENWRI